MIREDRRHRGRGRGSVTGTGECYTVSKGSIAAPAMPTETAKGWIGLGTGSWHAELAPAERWTIDWTARRSATTGPKSAHARRERVTPADTPATEREAKCYSYHHTASNVLRSRLEAVHARGGKARGTTVLEARGIDTGYRYRRGYPGRYPEAVRRISTALGVDSFSMSKSFRIPGRLPVI